jgi:hypothetical protein
MQHRATESTQTSRINTDLPDAPEAAETRAQTGAQIK